MAFASWDQNTKLFKTIECHDIQYTQQFKIPYNIITPPKNEGVDHYHNALRGSFWSVHHFSFNQDRAIVLELDLELAEQLKKILAFFTIVESPIADNLTTFHDVPSPHIQKLFCNQYLQELEHGQTYAKMLINAFDIPEPNLRNFLAEYIDMEEIGKKNEWMNKNLGPENHLLLRFANSAFAEGILFQSSFACICYLKYKNFNFDALFNANQYILRDEALHYRMFQWLFTSLRRAASIDLSELDEQIKTSFLTCVELEKDFIKSICKNSNSFHTLPLDVLIDYIDYTAELVWNGLYPDKNFIKRENPCDFVKMEEIPQIINHFEKKNIYYNSVIPKINFNYTPGQNVFSSFK